MKARLPVFGALCALGASLSLVACDPCSGVVSCDAGPARLAVEGRILDPWDGLPVAGTTITFVRTGGVELAADSVTGVADRDGRFTLAIDALAAGDVAVEVHVRSGREWEPTYRIPSLTLRATTGRGAGRVLTPWTSRLHFPYSAQLHYRFKRDSLARNIPITIRRTGGTDYYGTGVANGVYRTGTNAFGQVPFFGDSAYATSTEDLVVEVSAQLGAPYNSTSFARNVHLTPSYEYKPGIRVISVGIGPSLEYAGAFQLNATLAPLGSVRVDFKRTGGINAVPETFTATSDQNGFFIFPLTPLGDGTLLGDLTVTPPPPNAPYVIKVQMPTKYEDGGSLFARWGVGPHLMYYGRITAGENKGVAGAEVELRRTGGIQVEPASSFATTEAQGYFPMQPIPLARGELIADLYVKPPAPYAAFVVRGLRMPTSDEFVSGARSFGSWDALKPPPQ